jgi:hypothetical protein
MESFNHLSVSIQCAIWELGLPASRGVHWIEVEGIPHHPEFVRDSIRLTHLEGAGEGVQHGCSMLSTEY